MCARPYLFYMYYIISSSQQHCNYCYYHCNDEKDWGTQRVSNTSEATHSIFETRLSYIRASLLTLPKMCAHLYVYCNTPQSIYVNSSFVLGMRWQEEKIMTFTLNFHMYCVSDVKTHINIITIFCRLWDLPYHMPSFHRDSGRLFFVFLFSFWSSLAPICFILMSPVLNFIVILIIPVLPHQSLSKFWVIFAYLVF